MSDCLICGGDGWAYKPKPSEELAAVRCPCGVKPKLNMMYARWLLRNDKLVCEQNDPWPERVWDSLERTHEVKRSYPCGAPVEGYRWAVGGG